MRRCRSKKLPKQIKLPFSIQTCAPISKLPSITSNMGEGEVSLRRTYINFRVNRANEKLFFKYAGMFFSDLKHISDNQWVNIDFINSKTLTVKI